MKEYFEKIANKFGYYKLPRYWIDIIHKDGSIGRSGCAGKPNIFSYYEMLKFTALLEHYNMKFKIEKIEV